MLDKILTSVVAFGMAAGAVGKFFLGIGIDKYKATKKDWKRKKEKEKNTCKKPC